MSKTTVANSAEPTPTVAAPKVTPAPKAKVATPKVDKTAAAVEPKVKAPTKMDGARELVAKMTDAARKDVIAAMVNDLGISKPCAATNYQTIKATAKVSATA